ncbi:hypothetical protein METBIDRAFT_43948 [Metschnikowia bicuspidata var. bicuspidata NRRL YB-4993]|uniref:DUF866-domain-containing protein n=1 Tax=Metschnikowia bicuspidata var. bicuspidata NRRL YB-4993 TaxID=869754 RepID=A0A1A0H996_9ASCO|nr:hypothetical protein METBIDRAFT_43948 [Metschnikowia bicuspidata var. bicuspidata NRRL YB-4993]OBA20570.1 hypothetical protein METBIDRAFT_43948 [Metschnikowia bicuspidata var. bicuspidata NRRL YB-4993]
MVKFYLKAQAELSNVTNLKPVDTPDSPFEYTFRIECTKCREIHGKPVTINRFEQHDISGSKGEASFVFRCKSCRNEHSAQISRTVESLSPENAGKWVNLLEIDARGADFIDFIPEGRWVCEALNSTSIFDEVDLEDGEWYDYDDNKGQEVSVTDFKWEISR